MDKIQNKEIKERVEQLLKLSKSSSITYDIPKIQKSFDIAYSLLGEKEWEDGSPIIEHSVLVAEMVIDEIGLDTDSVCAALLHNMYESDLMTEDMLNLLPEKLGVQVAELLDGLTKINKLDTDSISEHSENFRRLMLALSGDLRVVLIKIADRVMDMRKISNLPENIQLKFSNESAHLYAPLAHRLGLYKLKTELEDISLKYLKPKEYYNIVKKLEATREERKKFVSEFVKPIEDTLKSKNFSFDMKARTKSIFSIWNKMKKSKVSFEEVYDLFAIRIILDSEPDKEKAECWQVYSIVTEEYQPNPDRLRDWISIPKSNGYESLHTTVMGPHGKWVEIQIRTKRMDEIAEKGLAAHWKYKGGQGSTELDNWLGSIREMLEKPDGSTDELLEEFRTNIYEKEIFVFTPKGDLKKLPAGATLLDFAYEIHSAVGDRCMGGKVNGRKVTIKQKLKNGDQVSIDTGNNQKPKIDWLEFVITSKAKSRIKASLNEEVRREAENGKEIIKRKFKNWKIEYTDDLIRTIITSLKLKTAQELYYKISIGEIEPLQLKALVATQEEEEESTKNLLTEFYPKKVVEDLAFDNDNEFLMIDKGISNINYKLSQCCNPIFGDEIFGFITIREGIKIHRANCPNAKQMINRYPYRVIKAKWQETRKSNSFQATIHLSGNDRGGIVGDISYIIAKDLGVQMRSINVDSKNGAFYGTLRVYVNNLEHLEFLMNKLKNIKGIQEVVRGDF